MSPLALSRRDWIAVGVGSSLVVLAYPPFHIFLPSIVCFAPVVVAVAHAETDARPLRRHLALGLWFGLFSSGAVLSWMPVTLGRLPPTLLAAYPVLVLLSGAHAAAAFGLVGWVRRLTRLPMVVVFPFVWTAAEWVLGHLGPFSVPWLGLGTSLTGYAVMVQIADTIGARGVGFLLAMANAALGIAWMHRSTPGRSAKLVGAVVLGILAAGAYGAYRMRTLTLRASTSVIAVQTASGPRVRWTDAARDSAVLEALRLSEAALSAADADLVVWPESSVPGSTPTSPGASARIAALAQHFRTDLLVGAEDRLVRPSGDSVRFNAAFLFDRDGRPPALRVYRKRRLVPLVESVPVVGEGLLHSLWGFEPGRAPLVTGAGEGRVGVLICFESVFEDLAREYRARGADWIVNITNDAWLAGTAGIDQHAAHLVMRAIENRLGAVRVANAGLTLFVDPLGRQMHASSPGGPSFVSRQAVTADQAPPYSSLGDWVGWAAVCGAAVLLGMAGSRRAGL